jgi:hypothetical protein
MPFSRFIPFGVMFLLLGQVRGQSPDFWRVSTRACQQTLGSDPGPSLQACRLDFRGRMSPRDPAELQVISAGRPIIFLAHGSYYTAGMANTEGLRIGGDLAKGAVTPDAIIVEFDWPSQLAHLNLYRDGNEKARLAFVAGYHLARFLQGFPPGSRISLIGHSHGGLVVLSALQLLAGATLSDGEDATALREASPALRLRAVIIAAGADRHWLVPGERLGSALAACEGILCLYNPLDPVLVVHPFGRYSEGHRALGKWGMSDFDRERLGSLADRYSQRSIATLLGPTHTFRGTTARPEAIHWIGAYTWAQPE